MLSDSLFDVRRKLQEEIAEHSRGTFGADYPNAQRKSYTISTDGIRQF